MIGKRIKVNDYKFVYGQETIYLNVYGAFKYKKNGNKYVIYSYDNTKLYFGTLFIRNNEMIIMTSKEDVSDIIKNFVYLIIENKFSDDFEIISLNDIVSVQIIDEHLCDFAIDIKKLEDLTIPKIEDKKESKPKKNKKKSVLFFVLLISIFLVIIILYFMINIIIGTSRSYLCEKNYLHNEMPAEVREEVTLIFDNNTITSIITQTDYVFSNLDYYNEFKDNSYFYRYIEDGDNYRFDDVTHTYRLFSNIDLNDDYMMPSGLDDLISYYEDNKYICNKIEEE